MTTLRIGAGIRDNFFMAANDFARDPNITPRACKVYIYLISHREGWKISVNSVAGATGMGKNTVAAALRDLVEAGFIERHRVKDASGKFTGTEYVIHQVRQPKPKKGETAGEGHEPESGLWNDQREHGNGAGRSTNQFVGSGDDQQEQDVSAGEVHNPENGSLKKTIPKKTNKEESPCSPPRDSSNEEQALIPAPESSKPKRSTPHYLPEGWTPKPETISKMRERYPSVNLGLEHEKFTNHWMAESGSNARKRDWDAAWQNWIIRAAEWQGNQRRGSHNNGGQAPAGHRRINAAERKRLESMLLLDNYDPRIPQILETGYVPITGFSPQQAGPQQTSLIDDGPQWAIGA